MQPRRNRCPAASDAFPAKRRFFGIFLPEKG
jgi:hypothetical protein